MAKFAREVDSELCNSYCTIPWGHVVKLLDKTNPGERREWYRGEEDIHYTSGMSLVEAKHRLVAAGLEESPIDMSETELRALARKNGYELVELLQGARPGEQLLVVRCASDGSAALYAYECENWNCKDDAPKLDGEIYIEFEPIATARKIVRTKRYPQGIPLNGMAENVDFYELMEAGSLSVRNCSNTTRCDTNGVDLQAFSLISKIAYHI